MRSHPVQTAGRAAALTLILAVVALLPVAASGARGRAQRPQLAAAASPAAIVARLSTAQLAGQRIIDAYGGLTPPASLLRAIRAGEVAGVIFFGPNVSSPVQLRGVIAQLQRANAAGPVRAPLLMLTDQEGGLVRRLPGAPALSERQIGASAAASALAAAAGSGAAGTLRAVGINVNLAPVLDVFRAPGNFIDRFQRSYSSSASVAAALGSAFIAAQQHAGVAATAKHFPGLGAATASQNTDERPVTLPLSLSALRTIDEAPYRAVIAAGVRLVMVSWATYPALDPRRPAGLSQQVIGGELRGRLRFRGVTLTDGLGAGALSAFGGFARRGVLAAQAGADLLLCSVLVPQDNTPANGLAALGGIQAGLARGTLDRASAQQAAARVIALRASL